MLTHQAARGSRGRGRAVLLGRAGVLLARRRARRRHRRGTQRATRPSRSRGLWRRGRPLRPAEANRPGEYAVHRLALETYHIDHSSKWIAIIFMNFIDVQSWRWGKP